MLDFALNMVSVYIYIYVFQRDRQIVHEDKFVECIWRSLGLHNDHWICMTNHTTRYFTTKLILSSNKCAN